MSYSVGFHEDAKKRLLALDFSVREKMLKRIARMQDEPTGRHLRRGVPFFVIEVGQYRIAYYCDENKKEKEIYFVGDHKEYQKWYNLL